MYYFKITTVLLLFFSLTLVGQEKSIENFSITKELITVVYSYKNDKKETITETSYYQKKITDQSELENAIKNNYFFEKNFKVINDSVKINNLMINNAMMNIFFADEVARYLSSSKDLTFKKAYSVISTADKTLFLGATFDFNRSKEVQKLTHLFTFGLKAKLNDGFAALLNYENGNLQNDVGFNFKYTLVGLGTLNYKGYAEELTNLNEKVIVPDFIKKVNTAKKNDTYVKDLKDYENIYGECSKKFKNKNKTYYKNKYDELSLELAKKEVAMIKEEKLYSWFKDYYYTIELYAPLQSTLYNSVPEITTNLNTSDFNEQSFYPWSLTAGYTKFWKKNTGQLFYLSGFTSLFNNNSILTKDLTAKTLQTFNATNSNLLETTSTFYPGEFKQFVTFATRAEAIVFPFNDWVGVAAAVEKNWGVNYDVVNWKLGVPFSLEDKEGKPNINFEIQWKEENNQHYLGLGIGLAFGKFVK